jgi:hypothetical protein
VVPRFHAPVRSLRAAVPATVLAAAAPIAAAAATSKPAKPPTAAQIRAAVRQAKASPDLWATVNVCDTADHPDQIGIRGQVPGLGFRTRILMSVTVQYYSSTTQRFESTSATQDIDLGLLQKGSQQAGYTFPFKPPVAGQTYVLRGVIDVRWRLGSKTLGSAVVHTKHGYTGVRFSDPPRYSAGTCAISGDQPAPVASSSSS